MTTNILNMNIEQGADWEFAITLFDKTTKLPIDVSLFVCKMQGRAEFGGAALFTISDVATSSGKITPGVDGSVKWRLRASVTVALEAPSTIHYDLMMVAPDGSVLKPVRGELTVVPGATTL